MSISINGIRENENDKTIFFTIVIDAPPTIYKWHADVPSSVKDVLGYLNQREDKLHVLVHVNEYPGSDFMRFKTEENTELEAMHEWIAEGCENSDGMVIDKVEWKSTHPDWIQEEEEKVKKKYLTVTKKMGKVTRHEFRSGDQRDVILAVIETYLEDTRIGKEKGAVILKVKDAFGEREGIKIESSGSETKISVFGEDAIIQQPHIANADGTLADITTKFNLLKSYVENFGVTKKS